MKLTNRLIVFTKRIFSHKMYLAMLFTLIALTCIYKLTPSKNKVADIRVAIFFENDDDIHNELLMEKLADSNSLYTFFECSSKDELLRQVKSTQAECGFVFSSDFFGSYITGEAANDIITLYSTPSQTLSSPITQSLFSNILHVCSGEILTNAIDIDEYNTELLERLNGYLNSEQVFTLSSLNSGEFSFETTEYTVQIPVQECSIIMLIFSGLLGLLLFLKDCEGNMYIMFSRPDQFKTLALLALSAMSPIFIVGALCSIIIYSISTSLLALLIVYISVFIATMLLSLVIKKSTLLVKVLPIIMLISIIVTFVIGLF